MTELIRIEFTPSEGSVLRLLGTVERRGFRVHNMKMTSQGGVGSMALEVRGLDESRRLEVVAGQLRRLADVRAVSCSPAFDGSFQ